jgi:hypothetical protein
LEAEARAAAEATAAARLKAERNAAAAAAARKAEEEAAAEAERQRVAAEAAEAEAKAEEDRRTAGRRRLDRLAEAAEASANAPGAAEEGPAPPEEIDQTLQAQRSTMKADKKTRESEFYQKLVADPGPHGHLRLLRIVSNILGLSDALGRRMRYRFETVGKQFGTPLRVPVKLDLAIYFNELFNLKGEKNRLFFNGMLNEIQKLLKYNYPEYPRLGGFIEEDILTMVSKNQYFNTSGLEQADKWGKPPRGATVVPGTFRPMFGGGERSGNAGKNGKNNKGNSQSRKSKFCDSMLQLLFLEASLDPNFDPQEYLDKAAATLDDLGQCPLVLHVLNQLLDQVENEGGQRQQTNNILFTPFQNEDPDSPLQTQLQVLESSFNSRFEPEEREVLANFMTPLTIYSKPPEEYSQLLGTSPFTLSTRLPETEEVEVFGIEEDPITITPEEQTVLKGHGGIPQGALVFFYLVALRDLAESSRWTAEAERAQADQEKKEEKMSSAASLKPRRTAKRSRTPKAKGNKDINNNRK